MIKSISQRVQFDNQIRFILAFSLFFLGILASSNNFLSVFFPLTLLLAAYGSFLGAVHWLAKKRHVSPAFRYVILVVDIAAVTAGILMTGGATSPLFILYVPILGLSLYHAEKGEVVFSLVLASLLLMGGFVLEAVHWQTVLLPFLGQTLLVAIMTTFLQIIFSRMDEDRRNKEKLLFQAQTIAAIADMLAGPLSKTKDVLKNVGGVLNNSMGNLGLESQIEIHKEGRAFVPQSGPRYLAAIPIKVGDHVEGSILIRKKGAVGVLLPSDHDFLSTIARNIGLYLHRTRIWEEFQGQLEKIEASLLVHERPLGVPSQQPANDHRALRDMIDVVKMERGRWTVQSVAMDFKTIVYEEIDRAMTQAAGRRVSVVMDGNFQNIPVIVGDPARLRQLFQQLLQQALAATNPGGEVRISVRYDAGHVTFAIEDQGDGGIQGPILILSNLVEDRPLERGSEAERLDWALVICKKIVDSHKGTFWAESKGPGLGRIFSFSLPFTPDEHMHHTVRIADDILEQVRR